MSARKLSSTARSESQFWQPKGKRSGSGWRRPNASGSIASRSTNGAESPGTQGQGEGSTRGGKRAAAARQPQAAAAPPAGRDHHRISKKTFGAAGDPAHKSPHERGRRMNAVEQLAAVAGVARACQAYAVPRAS